ncbi:aspartyl/asparaginyl beta-hydroxylase domain-containing protein [Niastella sp. OAS944]|uniref:aspartyl/asparaginyl beta-hydroxylase domain-containing protein n=1 Tax=Niastella sp. OAS944 TaxID=2664089 RepID=UPI003493E537|nr:quercetin dioxygenase-like cupin family protein [Chitinophagaceae bacterium OAS944]
MSIIKSAILNIPVDIKSIQKEVTILQAELWQPHLNKWDYEGGWDVLSLRSPGGGLNTLAEALNNEPYANTLLLKQCPSVRLLLDSLQCEKLSARFLNLHAGAVIKEHTDKELYFEKGEARLHFPIVTNPFVEFYLDNERLPMQEGECWYINANLPHRLANNGSNNRIHLVVDCMVNDWLQEVFRNCITKTELMERDIVLRNKNTTIQIINELRMRADSTSVQLANELERQLNEAEGGG